MKIVVQDNYKIEKRVEIAAYLAVILGIINISIILFLSLIILHGGVR